jgi:hypothetical protein
LCKKFKMLLISLDHTDVLLLTEQQFYTITHTPFSTAAADSSIDKRRPITSMTQMFFGLSVALGKNTSSHFTMLTHTETRNHNQQLYNLRLITFESVLLDGNVYIFYVAYQAQRYFSDKNRHGLVLYTPNLLIFFEKLNLTGN